MSVAVAESRLDVDEESASVIALRLPEGLRLQVSPEDFAALCQHNGDLRLERTCQEELIAMSPAGFDAGGA